MRCHLNPQPTRSETRQRRHPPRGKVSRHNGDLHMASIHKEISLTVMEEGA